MSAVLVNKIKEGARYARELSMKHPGVYFTIRVIPEGFVVDGKNMVTGAVKNFHIGFNELEEGNLNLLVYRLSDSLDYITSK